MDKITQDFTQFLKTGSIKEFLVPVNHEEVTLGYQTLDCMKIFSV